MTGIGNSTKPKHTSASTHLNTRLYRARKPHELPSQQRSCTILNWHNKPKEKSPSMPPAWLLIALLPSIIYAGQADTSYQAKSWSCKMNQHQFIKNVSCKALREL
jgi:hypothetical protein